MDRGQRRGTRRQSRPQDLRFRRILRFLGSGESKDLLRLRRPLILRSSDSKDKWRPMGPTVDEGIRFEKIRPFTSLTAKLSADELVKRTKKMSARKEYIRSLLTPGNDDKWRQITSLEGVRRTTTAEEALVLDATLRMRARGITGTRPEAEESHPMATDA